MTHAKVLVGECFYIKTSFNWMSLRGDPSRNRQEEGDLVQDQVLADGSYDKYITDNLGHALEVPGTIRPKNQALVGVDVATCPAPSQSLEQSANKPESISRRKKGHRRTVVSTNGRPVRTRVGRLRSKTPCWTVPLGLHQNGQVNAGMVRAPFWCSVATQALRTVGQGDGSVIYTAHTGVVSYSIDGIPL